ncbi:pretoxin HINT domain protein [Neisseria meningitidis NM607]|uniref:HINT domain-containing protein n=1 Tax=Neisseria meningitidis TaxID=487 RepID=UPI00032FFDAA|nr:HINT domain-containing protein [Neisseria meningitidis]EOB95413.1 pretoxin HINT domain protein [Neisseria meningitidis NM607]
MVKTADGYKAIAHIQAGDRVFAKDETSGKTGYKPVTARYGNPYRETVYIKVSDGIANSQTLISNRIHPFYSQGKWIQAGRLKKGDTLLSESGAKQTVQNITLKQQPLKAYNLTVADWHTYFVKGDKAETEGVWVHNECPTKPKPTNHAQQRKEEAKNDSHRSVGDSNRVVREGKQYLDADTGNHVYVKGEKVVILTPDGRQVTQFKNSKANTSKRVKNGKWTPK